MAFQNIALSGQIACGSTTLAKTLSQKLQWPMRDGGQIFRDVMKGEGWDLERQPDKRSDDLDRLVDGKTKAMLASLSPVVVTAKLAGFLSREIPHTMRVLLVCSRNIRIERYQQSRGYRPAEAERLLTLREKVDQERWERLYGHRDFFDPSFFHLVLDSGTLSVEEEVQRIIERCECCE